MNREEADKFAKIVFDYLRARDDELDEEDVNRIINVDGSLSKFYTKIRQLRHKSFPGRRFIDGILYYEEEPDQFDPGRKIRFIGEDCCWKISDSVLLIIN